MFLQHVVANATVLNCAEICGISYDYLFYLISSTSKQRCQVALSMTEAHLGLLCFVRKSYIWILSFRRIAGVKHFHCCLINVSSCIRQQQNILQVLTLSLHFSLHLFLCLVSDPNALGQHGPDHALIGGVVAVVVFITLCLIIVLGRYLARHKGKRGHLISFEWHFSCLE